LDFSDPASPAKLVNDVEQAIGPIDVLLNINNGQTLSSFIHTGDFSEWWSEIERNLRVPIALIHAVLPPMVLRGKGTIITTVFRTGAIQLPFCSSSSTAHSALLRFHHGLDEEIRPKGIYSYAVHPGLIASYLDDPEVELHDPKHYFLEPRLLALKKSFFEEDPPQLWCSSGLASGTFLTLAADPRAKALSGLYVDAERDLGELIEEMEKGDASRVIREKMNVLKVDEL
jgi:NAD(P)-dependent dehydrogenase (short-subunit alcohol dehydrogenase family)